MVQEAMSYVEFAPDTETKVELIKALSNVTAGKVCALKYSNCCMRVLGTDVLWTG